jgi:hypothetical protein
MRKLAHKTKKSPKMPKLAQKTKNRPKGKISPNLVTLAVADSCPTHVNSFFSSNYWLSVFDKLQALVFRLILRPSLSIPG